MPVIYCSLYTQGQQGAGLKIFNLNMPLEKNNISKPLKYFSYRTQDDNGLELIPIECVKYICLITRNYTRRVQNIVQHPTSYLIKY